VRGTLWNSFLECCWCPSSHSAASLHHILLTRGPVPCSSIEAGIEPPTETPVLHVVFRVEEGPLSGRLGLVTPNPCTSVVPHDAGQAWGGLC